MKALRFMTEPELAKTMRHVGDVVKASVPAGTLYAVLVFDDPGLAQYIANCNRADVIRAMRECADRLEARDTVERVGFPEGT